MKRLYQFSFVSVLSFLLWGAEAAPLSAEIITGDRTDNISVTEPATWTVPNSVDSFTFSGVISGSASITKEGAGALTLSGNNTNNQSLTVNDGTVNLNNFNLFSNLTVNKGTVNINQVYSGKACLPTNCTVSLGNSGGDSAVLNLNKQYSLHQFVDFSIYSNAVLNLTAAMPENISWNGGTFTFAGGGTVQGIGNWEHGLTKVFVTGENAQATVSCPCSMIETSNITVEQASSTLLISGAMTQFGGNQTVLNKKGAGTVILSGANTYKGKTVIEGGSLKFDTVAALGGTSEIIVNSGTILAFGTDFNSSDAFTKPVTFNSNSAVELEVNSPDDCASLNLGNFTVTNPENLTTLYVDMSNYSGDPLSDSLTLLTGDFTPFINLSIVQINAPRGFEGVFSYENGALNASFREIPEPATWLLLLIAAPFSLMRRFRGLPRR